MSQLADLIDLLYKEVGTAEKPANSNKVKSVSYTHLGGDKVDHVGWVVNNNGDGTVTTIEGNTTRDGAKGSQSNGGEVAVKIRAYKKNKRGLAITITGFGTPKFKD